MAARSPQPAEPSGWTRIGVAAVCAVILAAFPIFDCPLQAQRVAVVPEQKRNQKNSRKTSREGEQRDSLFEFQPAATLQRRVEAGKTRRVLWQLGRGTHAIMITKKVAQTSLCESSIV